MKSQLLHKWGLFTVAAAVVVMTGACSREDRANADPSAEAAKTRDNALVRMVNAQGNGTSADLFFGQKKTFSEVQDKMVTDYTEVPGEREEVRLAIAGEPAAEPVAKDSEGLSEGQRYTVVAHQDENGKPTVKAFSDDASAPEAGKAKVRVINVDPNTKELDLARVGQDDAFVKGIDFSEGSDFKEVDPMKGSLEIRSSGKNVPTLVIPDVDLVAGKAYTFIVMGRAGRTDAISIEDTPEPAMAKTKASM